MLEGADPKPADALSAWQAVLIDLARCLRFYSRLPVPRLPWEADAHAVPEMRGLVRVVPLAGIVIGLLPALALGLALRLGLEPWLSATLSVTAMTIATGVLHEDGLADLADSFGGATRERKLAIMKDSLLGSYGATALILAFALRIGALATLAARLEPVSAGLAVMALAGLSRTAGLAPLTFLPPARPDGAAHAVGQPARDVFWLAAILCAVLAILLGLLGGLPKGAISLMLLGTGLAGWLMIRLSARLFQGQTGDVAGATQQMAEIVAMIGLLIAIEP
jgi:adenosylcobinamide-GDP ribazoletransferase